MSPHPLTTICICTRRRPEELGRTLTSLSRSTHLADQVVVSDDGHDEATEQVCRAAPVAVEYVLGPQRGLGANRNRAMAAARGDLILFLDDDCLLGPDFLELALACVADHERRHGKGRVIVSGAVLDSGHTVTAGDQTFLGFQSVPYGSDEGLRSIVISAALIPAMVCEEVKFDPLLVYGYEEVDFASRAAARGYLVVNCPGARNDHRPS
jgi:GT2 family glycosyltransferase